MLLFLCIPVTGMYGLPVGQRWNRLLIYKSNMSCNFFSAKADARETQVGVVGVSAECHARAGAHLGPDYVHSSIWIRINI